MNDLKKALEVYGVKGKIRVYDNGAVYVNGEYYGVYDFARRTFVD